MTWLWGLVGVALAGATWFVLQLMSSRGSVALIQGIETKQIADLGPGLVEVEGKVRIEGEAPLRSPLTLTPCVGWQLVIQEWLVHSSLEEGGRITTSRDLRRDSKWTEFLLDDGTGRVLVDAPRSEVFLLEDHLHRPSDEPERFAATLRQYGLEQTPEDPSAEPNIIRESLLADGDRVYVLGRHRDGRMELGPEGLLVVSDRDEKLLLRHHLRRARDAGQMALLLTLIGLALAAWLLFGKT